MFLSLRCSPRVIDRRDERDQAPYLEENETERGTDGLEGEVGQGIAVIR